MGKNFILKATVTGKRQITIPKELCDLLEIESGQQVIFKKEGEKIIFSKKNIYDLCFACKGTSEIEGNKCFVCNGSGKLKEDLFNNVFELFIEVAKSIRQIKSDRLSISFISQELDNEGNLKILEFPKFILNSDKISQNELLRVQDEFQKLLIKQYTPKSVNSKDKDIIPCIPTNAMLEEMLNTLTTKEAKEEIVNWFNEGYNKLFK
ncbi:AbrB/MazE/SpoVT family DNA-binding domain-containing protein [Clostridium perfringens]|nr:AbrB/MazE/SpoVT family DNA-binding domain-containing protein [Clostridium perfringens]EGT0013594.1 AbrB/MazE/SpoVT family DNA-binding domain-containing protein [Clostridium perfringens]